MNNVPTANLTRIDSAAKRERYIIRRIKEAEKNEIVLPYQLPEDEIRVLESKGYRVYWSGGATVIAW